MTATRETLVETEKRPLLMFAILSVALLCLVVSAWFGVRAATISPPDPQFSHAIQQIAGSSVENVDGKVTYIFSSVVEAAFIASINIYLYFNWIALLRSARNYIEVSRRAAREVDDGSAPETLSYAGFKFVMQLGQVLIVVMSIYLMIHERDIYRAIAGRFT